MKLVDYRPMSEDECGYCHFCSEKTLEECDVENGEKKLPICGDCAKEKGLIK